MGAVVLLLAVEASCGVGVAAVKGSIVVTVDMVGFGACGDSRRVEKEWQGAESKDDWKTDSLVLLLSFCCLCPVALAAENIIEPWENEGRTAQLWYCKVREATTYVQCSAMVLFDEPQSRCSV